MGTLWTFCLTLAITLFANAADFKTPVLLTSGGQSADPQMVKTLLTRENIGFEYVPLATAENLSGKGSVLIVLGGSSKGLGAAKVSAEQESARIAALLKSAHEQKIPVLAMRHRGQESSRRTFRCRLNKLGAQQADEIVVVTGGDEVLVYAFDVLIDIYRSCGWGERDAAKSILRTPYGLDIDRRAYQLAYFAVMMKARQYNRRICSPENQPNLANFADVMGADTDMPSGSIRRFAEQFAFADTYGSLMTVTAPADIDTAFSDFMPTIGLNMRQFDMMMKIYKILSQKYDVVCTTTIYGRFGNECEAVGVCQE